MSTSTETRPVAAEPSEADVVAIDRLQALHQQLRSELARVIIGQDAVVEDVLTDATTKKTDFGIQMGKPLGETKNIRSAMEIFKTLEGADKKPVERKVFKEELLKAKFTDEDAEKMIRTMFREGLIYESKSGFFKRVGT
jgi:replicative DNA helicase Mcm